MSGSGGHQPRPRGGPIPKPRDAGPADSELMKRHPAEDGPLIDRLRVHAFYQNGTFQPTTGKLLEEAADEIERLRKLNGELIAALDDADLAMRIGDPYRLHKIGFVWSQRRDHILAGEETWADQHIGEPLRVVEMPQPYDPDETQS